MSQPEKSERSIPRFMYDFELDRQIAQINGVMPTHRYILTSTTFSNCGIWNAIRLTRDIVGGVSMDARESPGVEFSAFRAVIV